jgi:glycosyltransferase involved in cell wall biosynthesis
MVSVIIPAYNYGHFIAETIDSLLAQTYRDFEIIIIDNGSTDETQAVLKNYNDKRVICIRQENHGVSHARNTGLKIAKGKYILFLDADDLIEKRKLETSVAFLEKNTDLDLVYSDMRYFKSGNINELFYEYSCDPNGKPWMKYISGKGKELVKTILYGNFMVICSPVFRRSLLEQCGYFNEELLANEDWELWLRFLLANKRIQYDDAPESKALVRIHKTSLSRDVFKMQIFGLKVLEINSEKIKSFGLEKEWEERVRGHVTAITATLAQSPSSLFEERINELKRINLLNYITKKQKASSWLRLGLKLRRLMNR